ncbi:uncharacterized protein LOC121235094 [Juglans microcarpa x Juglans regia]|uniref:uncharacterized protein LOC121235094 n=1 Tax=Juglans microcarpa x Juglans regia TaxID=2249226 RepID=UPI001B7E1E37|nr:uncharacterized protein LOC121235094 [Juglans microcarpa x Juglans regia]
MAAETEQMQDKEQEALRLKALAETKYNNSKLKSALKYAKRAQRLAPNLDGLSEMVTSFKILRVAAARSPDTPSPDWYKILQVEPFAHINTLKKQYKKLALVLHPDKNPYAGSEEAFKLVSEAFRFLSDRIRRKEYDMKLRIRIQEENVVGLAAAETFWTACSMCRLLHKFERRYLGHNLVCPNCKKSFEAVEVETDDGNKSGGEDAGVRVRSERLRKRNVGVVERFGVLGSKTKMGSGLMGSGMRAEELEREEDGVDRDGIWSCGRLRSWGLKRRMRTVGEVLERSMPKRAKTGEETMTLAEMQQEARRKVQQERMKEKEKDEREKRKEKEKERRRDLKKSGDLEIEKRGSSKKSGDSDIERRRKKSVGLEIERRRSSRGGDLEIMSVEDSDFYDFDKDRVERSFKKGQVWAIYDDDDGMPRHYGLIDEIVSVIPFEVKMSWLDLQSNGDEGLICLEKMGFHISCGKFKVAWKNSINSLNVFSHIVDCEQEAREVYRIYPRKGSVWALYNEAAVDAEGRNLSVKDKRCYDIVLFMTSYSEMYGLSMAYLEKVDGFKTIFKRREIGCHAIRLLEKHDLRLFSHQIPARKLSSDEAPEILKDCWELDPASLPPDLLGIGWKR